jgi:hypothetical protein
VETKTAIKIGLVAGLISALFPSIPTIIHFQYYTMSWFLIYAITGLAVVAALVWW